MYKTKLKHIIISKPKTGFMIIKKIMRLKDMKTKIIIGTLLLFLIIGIASAADVNNLKCPDGWEHVTKGNYRELGDTPNGPGSGRNMMAMEFTQANCGDYLENDTSENYFIFKNSDNTYNYTDWTLNSDEGCFEVVDIDGKQYFLVFSSNIENDYSGKLNIYETMLEFNKLNKLTPVQI